MQFPPGAEATYVAGLRGRDACLAVWVRDTDGDVAAQAGVEGETTTVPIAFADGVRPVVAELVPMGPAIRSLAAVTSDESTGPSVVAWAVGVRLALELISRGRLLPAVAGDGTDRWRIGPLDNADRARLDQLADALPPPAHAHPVDEGREGPRVLTPQAAVTSFIDAVADAFVRTPAATVAAGSEAFASPDTTSDVSSVESWLQSVTAGSRGDTAVGLRVDVPDKGDGDVRAVIQVQSRVDPSLVLDAGALWTAPDAVLTRFGDEVETELLLTLRRAARVWGPAERFLAMATPDAIDLDDDDLEQLFGPVADDLAAAGLPVLWPRDVFRPIEVRPVVDTPQPDAVTRGRLDLAGLGEIRWHATIDGTDLTESELLELANAKRPMVRLRGQWVRADPARLARLNERRTLAAGDAISAALSGQVTVEGETVAADVSPALTELAARLDNLTDAPAQSVPAGLDATLRPYQERGLAWLAEMTHLGLGGVLADDMGLGKTIQILALHLQRHGADPDAGPTLVVCPATLMSNWEREAARFTPSVRTIRYHGPDRSLDGAVGNTLVVATYGVARRDADLLDGTDWDLVVADEAQAIKNPLSRTARAVRQIGARARIALTGTPVENHLSDLWALLDWTTPGLLGPLDPFQRTIAARIERDKDPEATERLATMVRPFLLRRRKSDPEIAPDLPPKTETDRFVGITVEQATLYRAVVDEMMEPIANSDEFTRQGQVLKLLTALKQICNHPAQYLGQDGPLAGRSGKLDAVGELVSVIADEGDSTLVFTQYVGMGHLLTAHLAAAGIDSLFLHGSVPVTARGAMVDRFQAGDPKAFVISLKAGGTGLNLTRATHVVHYDRWWNPAVEDQASDRAWRIGQDRPVQVHRMVCEGTLEERIARILDEKRGLADTVVGGGEAWLSKLSIDELSALVSLKDGF